MLAFHGEKHLLAQLALLFGEVRNIGLYFWSIGGEVVLLEDGLSGRSCIRACPSPPADGVGDTKQDVCLIEVNRRHACRHDPEQHTPHHSERRRGLVVGLLPLCPDDGTADQRG